MKRLLLTVLIVCSQSIEPAGAQEDSAPGEVWGAYGLLSYSVWDGLGDVQPLGRGGPFETRGVGIDFGGYASIARFDSVLLLAGAEFGFLGLNSDVLFEDDPAAGSLESAFEVNHLAATLTARFGQRGGRFLDLRAGLGRYYADTKYIDCSVIVRCFSAETGDSDTGAFLELSGSPGKGVLLGARIHFVDFDPIEAVDLAVKDLDGPIYSIFVGWQYSNWRRE